MKASISVESTRGVVNSRFRDEFLSIELFT